MLDEYTYKECTYLEFSLIAPFQCLAPPQHCLSTDTCHTCVHVDPVPRRMRTCMVTRCSGHLRVTSTNLGLAQDTKVGVSQINDLRNRKLKFITYLLLNGLEFIAEKCVKNL